MDLWQCPGGTILKAYTTAQHGPNGTGERDKGGRLPRAIRSGWQRSALRCGLGGGRAVAGPRPPLRPEDALEGKALAVVKAREHGNARVGVGGGVRRPSLPPPMPRPLHRPSPRVWGGRPAESAALTHGVFCGPMRTPFPPPPPCPPNALSTEHFCSDRISLGPN